VAKNLMIASTAVLKFLSYWNKKFRLAYLERFLQKALGFWYLPELK
jgi:hypothetical protein